MFDVFEEMSKLIPFQSCQKFRKDKEFLIVTNMNNYMTYLNETAGDIFLLCNNQNTIQDILEALLAEYQVNEDILKKDIVNTIRDLQWNHLIELRHRV